MLAAIAVTLIAVVGGLAWQSGRTPVVAAEETVQRPSSFAPARTMPVVSVIGDSISSGTQKNTVKWPELVGRARGWHMNSVASGGAGYVNGADKQRDFAAEVAAAVGARPDMIVVAGGRNDRNADPAAAGAAATNLYTALRQQASGAQIVVVGPIWSAATAPASMYAVNDAIRAAASAAGIQFIDALNENWLGNPRLIQEDNTHPTDEGNSC
ncbi:hypothetical protein GS539_29005 [Rhodococcus hoagii]|nr:hypothetical protein [Prescottella equi]